MRSARDKNRNQFSSFMKLARRQPEIRIRLIIPGCRHRRMTVSWQPAMPPSLSFFGKGGQSKFLPALASSCPTELQASLSSTKAPPSPKR